LTVWVRDSVHSITLHTRHFPDDTRMANPLLGPLLAFAGRLRFPTLFLVTLGLFAVDVIVPDFVPFADEILLGLGALLFSAWKKPRPVR
jgi:hypothetical protein